LVEGGIDIRFGEVEGEAFDGGILARGDVLGDEAAGEVVEQAAGARAQGFVVVLE